MPHTDSTTQGAGGTGLLVMMATATVLCTAVIAGFCVLGAWWLLPVVMATLLAVTLGVVAVLVRLMGDDGLGAH